MDSIQNHAKMSRMDESFISAIDKFVDSLPLDKLHRKLNSAVAQDVIEDIDKFYTDFFNDWLEHHALWEPGEESALRLRDRVHYMRAKDRYEAAKNDPGEEQQAVAALHAAVLKPDYFEHFDPADPDLLPEEVGIYELYRRINEWQDIVYHTATADRELTDTDETGETFIEPLDIEPALKRVCLQVAEACLTLLPQIMRESYGDDAADYPFKYDPIQTFDQFLRQFHSLLETQAERLEVHREPKDRREFSWCLFRLTFQPCS